MSSLQMSAGLELIASLLSVAFMGALLVVVFDYWQRFPNDKFVYRALVVLMTAIALADTIFNASSVYEMLITHFGHQEYVIKNTWQFAALFPSIGVSCTVLQSFLVYRIYIVSAKRWKVIPAVTMALTITGASMSLYVAGWLPSQELVTDLGKRNYIVWTWYACHAVSDLLTTGSLLYFIVWKPYSTGGGMSRSVTLQRVVMRAVESNALSLVWQTLVVSFFAKGETLGFLYAIPAYTLVKIYAYSLMSALNTRNSDVDREGHSSSRGPMTSYGGGGAAPGTTAFKRSTAAFGGRTGGQTRSRFEEVQVTVVHDVEVDDEAEIYKMRTLEEGVESAGGIAREAVRVNLGQGGGVGARERTREEKVRDLGLAQEKW